MLNIKVLMLLLVFMFAPLHAQSIVNPSSLKNLPQHDKSAVFLQKEKKLDGPADIYRNIKPVNVHLENSLDPYEQQENHETYRSPYPLIRTTQSIYAQGVQITPGYYLLTPRKLGAKTYMFFKQQGKVSYIVPVFAIDDVDVEKEYPQAKDPFEKFPWGVRHVIKFVNIMVGRYTPPIKVPEHKLDCFQYDSEYYGINVYYKDKLYKTIYQLEKHDEYL